MKTKTRGLYGFLMVFLTVMLCAGLLEFGCCVFIPARSLFDIDVLSHGSLYTLSNNPKLIYVPKKNTGEHNSYGHRGKAYPFEKTGKTRIVLIGDSVAEGYGVASGERFSSLLNARFAKSHEFINLGVCGYDFRQEAEYLKQLGLRFSPDYVFWAISHYDLAMWSGEIYALNETMRNMKKNSFYMHYYGARGWLNRGLLHSHAYRCVRYLAAARTNQKFEKAVGYEPDDNKFKSLLVKLKSLEKKHGFKILFIYLPVNEDAALHSDAEKNMKTMIHETDFISCDPGKYINSKLTTDEKDALFIQNDIVHLTLYGHQAVAVLLSIVLEQLPSSG